LLLVFVSLRLPPFNFKFFLVYTILKKIASKIFKKLIFPFKWMKKSVKNNWNIKKS